jgi:hypothetical protein
MYLFTILYAPETMLHSTHNPFILEILHGKSDMCLVCEVNLLGLKPNKLPIESFLVKSISNVHLISDLRVLLFPFKSKNGSVAVCLVFLFSRSTNFASFSLK